MSLTDGNGSRTSTEGTPVIGPATFGELVADRTATGAITLTDQSRNIQRIDPDGSHRDVSFAASAEKRGSYFRIINSAGGAENLVVKNAAGTTLATLNQNEQGEFWHSGSAWIVLCVTTIALS